MANNTRLIVFLTIVIAMVGLAFDISLPLGVAGGVPYIVLVLVAQWFPKKTYIYHMATLGTFLTIVGYFASPAGGIAWVVASNRALAIFAIWVTALLCFRVQKGEANLRAVIDTADTREMRLRDMLNIIKLSPISIIITNAEGNIEYVNPYFSKLAGYQEQEVLGKNPRLMKSGNTHEDIYQQMWQTISSGKTWRGVLQNRKKNGELFWVSATIVPVGEQIGGGIEHFIAFNEDITHLREKEDMLTHAMKLEAVGRMTNGIAHDFRNLLTIILGNLQLLQEGIIEKDSELIDDALSAAGDGTELIKLLLAFSHRKEHKLQSLDVNAFIQELLRLLYRTVEDNVNLSLLLTEAAITVKADPNRLESALLNLVINAQDAMPRGGNVRVTTDLVSLDKEQLTDHENLQAGDYATICISDDGVGMDNDARQRALEPFYSTKSTGTGLGLSMVDDFIYASGGMINIESTVGSGTNITLFLPVAKMTERQDEGDSEEVDSLPCGEETILLVEDTYKLRVFTNRILTHLGYQIVKAANAADALEYLRTNKDIELLFTDIVMPGSMNGLELANKAHAELPSLKILLTTGMESYINKHKTPDTDFPLLVKPYTPQQLSHIIRRLFDST
jgi:PAS domain S-box-containing protein